MLPSCLQKDLHKRIPFKHIIRVSSYWQIKPYTQLLTFEIYVMIIDLLKYMSHSYALNVPSISIQTIQPLPGSKIFSSPQTKPDGWRISPKHLKGTMKNAENW